MSAASELLNIKFRKFALILTFGLLLAGCSREGAAPKQGVDDAGSASASFVNKVWRVSASSSVAASTLYILRLSAAEFKIRSNNPRQPVETTLVPAESRALSK